MEENETSSHMNLKIALMQGFYWAIHCVLFSFLVPLFQAMGYSKFETGILTMLIAISNMIAQPLWGMYCDRNGRIKTVFISQMATGCLLIFLLPLSGKSMLIAAVVVIGLTVSIQSMSGIIDSWSVKLMFDGVRVNYGWTRSFGSLFFAAAALTFGMLLDQHGDWIRMPVLAGLIALIVLIACSLKKPSHPITTSLPERTEGAEVIRSLLRNKRYVRFIFCSFLVRLGGSASLIFYPLLVSELGGNNSDLGLGLFLMAISEVPVMMMFGVLARKVAGVPVWLAIGMSFFGIKTALLALSPNVGWVVGLQALEALSYGLYLPAAIHYISDAVERKFLVTAQMVFSAIFNGLSLFIGSLIGGILSEIYGVGQMMLWMSGTSFLGVLLFLILESAKMKRTRNKVQEAEG